MERATHSVYDMSYHLVWAPNYSIGKVVGILKAVSAGEIRKGSPRVKRDLWGGEFLGRRLLRSNGWRRGHDGNDHTIHPVSRREEETARAVMLGLRKPRPKGRGSVTGILALARGKRRKGSD